MSNPEPSASISEEFSWETIRLALESDGEGIYDWDIESRQIKYSAYCAELLGWKDKSLALPNIFTESEKVLMEEDRPHFNTSLRRHLEGRNNDAPFRIEMKFMNQTGASWRWLRITGIIIRSETRKPVRMVGAMVDITRRKTAESMLEEERHLFRLLIDHIPDNIFFKNRESRFVLANISTAKKLGVPTPSDLIGKTDANFFDKDRASEWRKEEIAVMESDKATPTALRRETWKTGKESWCLATKIPWKGKNNELKGLLGISSDVTSMVQAQNALKRIAAELELKNQAFEKEIRLAREVQLALLPTIIPQFSYEKGGISHQVDFSSKYQPSSGVAGDWYEVFPVTDSKVAVFICDVMGHGVRSALVASMIRGMLDDAVKEFPNPADFLTVVNTNLSRILARSEATMFATAFYMLMDLDKKVASYSTAGHPAPFVCSPSGNHVDSLEVPKGIAMGLIENYPYQEKSINMEDGMGFLLFTDGLIEATNKDGEELGSQRVQHYLKTEINESAVHGVTSVLGKASSFIGDKSFDDDICLLAVKYKENKKH